MVRKGNGDWEKVTPTNTMQDYRKANLGVYGTTNEKTGQLEPEEIGMKGSGIHAAGAFVGTDARLTQFQDDVGSLGRGRRAIRELLDMAKQFGKSVDPDLQLFCQRSSTPLFTTQVSAAEVIDHLRTYLTKIGAPQITMHGVFMDILGLGVLLTGESGLGKSELGLELISRGHGLVADDAVDFARLGPDYIEGRCPVILRNLLI